ncbi:hypothetical protein P167DRAFT_575963 [Morchella conica CCBAS932]|uniref:Uncharacterized protein n=1 Tax=Morchella conica CCBAS932 TaxID=1392247 RepID=A0A3N4KJE9_9PEZI|nr:hypothetical protein P167DRAFT_575963 [Morchella conica CCBAS932]
MPSPNTNLNINHPTSFPIQHFTLQTRITAIAKATSTHKLIRERLLTLKNDFKDCLTDLFLEALEREQNRVNRVLGDFATELKKVEGELEALEREEATRVGMKGKEARRRYT